MTVVKLFLIAFALTALFMFLALFQGELARAENIIVDNNPIGQVGAQKDFPMKDGILTASKGDSIYVRASKTPYSDIIVTVPDIVIKKSGDGAATIKPTETKGSTYCVLQRADDLTLDGITLDQSDANWQASFFGIRQEHGATGLVVKNCDIIGPVQDSYDNNQTSRKQLNYDHIDVSDVDYVKLIVDKTSFKNVVGEKPSYEDKADSDSTIVTTDATISSVSDKEQ